MSIPSPWQLASRAERMNPSILREILKASERPGVLSLAGGLPAAEAFPCDLLKAAADRVLSTQAQAALQYAPSEGYLPLREWVAEHLKARQGMQISPAQVLITHGSQQGLDLAGKVLMDRGSPVLVESPTYLGALQAFAPMEPRFEAWPGDEQGVLPASLSPGARVAYVVPSFQNPTGRCMPLVRRQAVVEAGQRMGVPFIEDDPYGALWYDAPPPAPLASLWPEGVIYLGSFSKVLVPGLRVGYVVTPDSLSAKFLQAKQAADLHTAGLNQRLVFELLSSGMLDTHVQRLRARYRVQRDAMATALTRHLPPGCRWGLPAGGMFFWVGLPDDRPTSFSTAGLLAEALSHGVAFVPGEAFYVAQSEATLRLSFVTLPPAQIEQAVARLGRLLTTALSHGVDRRKLTAHGA